MSRPVMSHAEPTVVRSLRRKRLMAARCRGFRAHVRLLAEPDPVALLPSVPPEMASRGTPSAASRAFRGWWEHAREDHLHVTREERRRNREPILCAGLHDRDVDVLELHRRRRNSRSAHRRASLRQSRETCERLGLGRRQRLLATDTTYSQKTTRLHLFNNRARC